MTACTPISRVKKKASATPASPPTIQFTLKTKATPASCTCSTRSIAEQNYFSLAELVFAQRATSPPLLVFGLDRREIAKGHLFFNEQYSAEQRYRYVLR